MTTQIIDLRLEADQIINLELESPPAINLKVSASIGEPGSPGPPGPPGAPGVPGADGQDAPNASYVHTQNVTSDTWVVEHNLGFYPAITVVDSGGTTVVGEVTHDSVNQVTVRFSSAFSGKVYAS